MWIRSLGWEDPLEEGMAMQSSILAWRIPRSEEPGRSWSTGSQSWTWLKWLSRHAHSAYKLNKYGHNIQPCSIPFPIWNQSVVPCPVLTVASWPAYRFLRRQVRCSGIPISFKNFPLKEETDRTGSILKAGLHLGLDCGLWAISPISMETTYQLENQAPPDGRAPGLVPRLSVA